MAESKHFNVSQIVVPYPGRSEKKSSSDHEDLTFNQMDSEFQFILIKEFARVLKDYKKG